MPDLIAEGDELRLRLRWPERLCAFHGDVRVPLRTVRAVRVSDDPWGELRGWRSTGVAVPGWMARGRRRHGDGWDVTVLRGHDPVVVVECNGAVYDRLVVGVADPAAVAAAVAGAAGIAAPEA